MIPSNKVHMLWQLPQIIMLTAGEIMYSITGLEFSFTQVNILRFLGYILDLTSGQDPPPPPMIFS